MPKDDEKMSFPRIEGVQRGQAITLAVDGKAIAAYAGESVAAALLASGKRILRHSPVLSAPRSTFCWMGVCQECVILIDGIRRPACRTEAADGMVVTTGKAS